MSAEKLRDSVDTVHRLGKKSTPATFNGRPRSIIIQFGLRTVKEEVWSKSREARVCQDLHIYFKKDYIKEDREARAKLYPLVQEAKKRNLKAYLLEGYAMIDGRRVDPPPEALRLQTRRSDFTVHICSATRYEAGTTIRMKLLVFLLMFVWKLSVSRGGLSLSLTWSLPDVADTEVSCVFMERCILPCSFQADTRVFIDWFQLTAGDFCTHSYYDNQDQLQHQHQMYRNRTSLFKDQISRGNASLQLTGVKVQDEGRYQCCTSTMNENNSSFVNVKVDAPVQEVNIQQVENRMSCSSEGIYPQPELTWSTTPPSNINLHNTTTVQQNEEQLYSISSSLILSDNDTDLVYSCTVKTRRNNMTASLSRTRKSVNGGIIGGVIGAVLVAAAVGLFLFYKKKKLHRHNLQKQHD
ncbi:programmed cell death 1 ligand 1-like [Acanthochromis polyacanthus]|uniref:programmed cell death 1 ligand 1-like n=1 Tax=Acanthochromis polyacanthus TaxID=80966 RepID=UPI0022344F19|nr:programmed cell death 1 ligand 1-like [Acanthochromis polyacanthus]